MEDALGARIEEASAIEAEVLAQVRTQRKGRLVSA